MKVGVLCIKKEGVHFDTPPFFCDLGGTRTHGPLIKSQLLYQLSYEVFLVASGFNRFAGANMQQYFLICKKIIL